MKDGESYEYESDRTRIRPYTSIKIINWPSCRFYFHLKYKFSIIRYDPYLFLSQKQRLELKKSRVNFLNIYLSPKSCLSNLLSIMVDLRLDSWELFPGIFSLFTEDKTSKYINKHLQILNTKLLFEYEISLFIRGIKYLGSRFIEFKSKFLSV